MTLRNSQSSMHARLHSNHSPLCRWPCFTQFKAIMSSESTSAGAAATGQGTASGEGSSRGVTFGVDGVSAASMPISQLSLKLISLQSGLAIQDLDSLDVSKLNPLSPEVISRQATINIGTCSAAGLLKSTGLFKSAHFFRNNWTCCSRKVYYCQIHFRCQGETSVLSE
jgi:hypothetical protein